MHIISLFSQSHTGDPVMLASLAKLTLPLFFFRLVILTHTHTHTSTEAHYMSVLLSQPMLTVSRLVSFSACQLTQRHKHAYLKIHIDIHTNKTWDTQSLPMADTHTHTVSVSSCLNCGANWQFITRLFFFRASDISELFKKATCWLFMLSLYTKMLCCLRSSNTFSATVLWKTCSFLDLFSFILNIDRSCRFLHKHVFFSVGSCAC